MLSSMNLYNIDVDKFRDEEYPMLKGKTYLDHAGTTLYSQSLIKEFADDMLAHLYGNPHSDSTPSALAGHRVDEIRGRVLQFFNASAKHFDLVFVANATAAIKLVMESFDDYVSNAPGKGPRKVWYGYHRDAHTSLVGNRELGGGLHRCFQSDDEVENWIEKETPTKKARVCLFGYPGQSNMTGRRLPLTWPAKIRESAHGANTFTLLDAAALATTSPLNLSDEATAPDFVSLSFYKIFGFPNIGALIIRKSAGHMLQWRRYFGGGTVEMVTVLNDSWHARKVTLHDQLELGTLPFHSIFALDAAIKVHNHLFKSMSAISAHTAYLAKVLYDGLSELVHYNGRRVCYIYKDDCATYGDPKTQGATLALNIFRANGSPVGFKDVEQTADHHGIYVRSGGLCNPGGVATYLDWSPAQMKAAYAAGHRCTMPMQTINGKLTGVVRVSLGAMSTLGDVSNLLDFVNEVYVETSATVTVNEQASLEQSTVSTNSEPEHLQKHTIVNKAFPRKSITKTRRWVNNISGLIRPRRHREALNSINAA